MQVEKGLEDANDCDTQSTELLDQPSQLIQQHSSQQEFGISLAHILNPID